MGLRGTPCPAPANTDHQGKTGQTSDMIMMRIMMMILCRLKDPRGRGAADQGPEHDIASTTTGLDLESVMALQTDLTSDEELSTTIDLSDAQAIRKQLDGLENMYTEVLKLLGQ